MLCSSPAAALCLSKVVIFDLEHELVILSQYLCHMVSNYEELCGENVFYVPFLVSCTNSAETRAYDGG